MEILILLILLAIIIVILLKYHHVITTCFFKRPFVKLILEVFALLFTILTFFYSFYNNIFTGIISHDNFITYPINQLLGNQSDYLQDLNCNNDYSNNAINKDSVNFVFLIDRTLSGINENDYVKKNYLITHNKDSLLLSINKQHVKMFDVLLLELINSFNSKGDSNLICRIVIYNGLKQNLTDQNSTKESKKKDIKPNEYRKYIDLINNSDNEDTNTDISKFFSLLDSTILKKRVRNVVTIISDFEHESKTSNILQLGIQIDSLLTHYSPAENPIILNLVTLNGNLKHNLESIKETKEIIEKYTHYIYLYNYEQGQIICKSNQKTRSSFVTQVPIREVRQRFYLYYPLSFGKFNKVYKSIIRFPKVKGKDEIWLSLKSESSLPEPLVMQITDRSTGMPYRLTDQPQLVSIDSSKQFSLELESLNKPENLFLEISEPNNLFRERISIEFKEHLTNEVCYILIILNSLLIIFFIFLSGFFYYLCNRHCYMIRNRNKLKLGSELILILPTISVVFFLVYSGLLIYKLEILTSFFFVTFLIVWLLIVVLCSWLLIRFFIFEKKGLDDKCIELHKSECEKRRKMHKTQKKRKNFKLVIFSLVTILVVSTSSCRHRNRDHSNISETQNITNINHNTSRSGHSHGKTVVKMNKESGVFHVPCKINGMEMEFIFDTGASNITMSLTEAMFLHKQGKLKNEDIIGKQQYQIADGSIHEGTIVVLRKVEIGNWELKNVKASVVDNMDAPLLLGQSALAAFGKISIDYNRSEITFE